MAAVGCLLAVQVRAEPHVPKPGSDERKAICDALRSHFVPMSMKQLPQPLVFKVRHMKVDGDYAAFEGTPVFKDGTSACDGYMPDMDYSALLKRVANGWKVMVDLSRSDVPSPEEVKEIRKKLPVGFPAGVMTDFWRSRLKP